MIIDGKVLATEILEDLKLRVEELKKDKVLPHLYIVTFGKNPQTESYLKQKLLRADQIGAKITIKRFPLKTSGKSVHSLIEKLNKDKKVNGIIVQRPLIKNLDEEKISSAVNLEKDVDGFNPHSRFSVPVALAVIKMIESTLSNKNILDFLRSKKITVVGKGITAGKPIIRHFQKLSVKIKVIDSKTKDKEKILRKSDIIISAVGKEVIKKEHVKKGATLIGVGMHTDSEGKLKGDFDEQEIKDKASFYSPTPGGVGPVNVAMLLKNLVHAAQASNRPSSSQNPTT